MHEPSRRSSIRNQLLITLFAALTFLVGIVSPPHLMDDVDGTQSEIAKTMLRSGNWVTAHLAGVPYLEKAPLKYWITASLYSVLGVSDWVARLPNAIAVIALCLLAYRIGLWAGSERSGVYAALALATSIGLFLFTRVVIPDVLLTLAIALAIWSFLRILEQDFQSSLRWTLIFYLSIACALLIKGLIGIIFPVTICLIFAAVTKDIRRRETWIKLRVLRGIALVLLISLPWHLLAILQNPPYFDITLHAEPNFAHKFRGFFWFYFINDQYLRFTNGRWPHDYNTVPRIWFWCYHLLWFFPWSFFLIGLQRADFRLDNRFGRVRVVALIWIGVVMMFFTLSTTQEYYSMPIYPALALLIGSAMAKSRPRIFTAARFAGVITAAAFLACVAILFETRRLAAPGDISGALSKKVSEDYTLALAHTGDLTLSAFAYLRMPLLLAAIAFLVGSVSLLRFRTARLYWGTAIMLAVFFQAARLALVTFDPYLSSYSLADALNGLPKGTLIFNGEYYRFSSVPFYTEYQPLILNGRINNLEYGSYAPGADRPFIDDQKFRALWTQPERVFVITFDADRKHLEDLVGPSNLCKVVDVGGKQLLTNLPVKSKPSS